MAGQERILCIDIGADSIKMSEFSCTSENIEMESFVYSEYTNDSDEATAQEAMIYALKEMLASNDFKAKKAFVAITGQDALIPFIKIPAMTTDPEKIRELVTYEAESRIPYPLSEVAWDYQLIEDQDGSDEIDAMLVSVKNDEVLAIRDALAEAGKKIVSIEVSPTALYNSARANGIGDSQCEMILNIGGKSSTLIFVDGPRFFIRTIPVAGNTITQQIAKEFNMSFADADEIKRRHGFVALGGAYEEPESDVAATVSKIIRNVMTRLHGEINRSINVYRASQHGRKPEKMYLAGGSSVMAFTPRFFVEKLRIPVDYFNAFQVINLSPDMNQEMLQEQAHLCGETIGLAMRSFRSTPVEIALVPESVKQQARMRQKLPYIYASAAVVLVYLLISLWSLGQQVDELQIKENRMNQKLSEKQVVKRSVEAAKRSQKASAVKHSYITDQLLQKRNSFLTALDVIQKGYVKEYFAEAAGNNQTLNEQLWFTNVVYSDKPEFSLKEKEKRSIRGEKKSEEKKASGTWLSFKGYIVSGKTGAGEHSTMLGKFVEGVLNKEYRLDSGTMNDYYKNDVVPGINLSAFTICWPVAK
ncbi:MAG: type IV pilus assembly protein PilM [Lentisphaeria bacterium]|nr:type IV pilus assembly protein PilM [Lentisphaeria bacterium]MBR4884913.1 type IV pilus assembly protein PilM [Lentisphaeria bacterium]